ncbi:3-keto-5-aminohexanoate cleavage protein [Olivibacter sp. SDN3]|uniref:3-keto-5-aminohexanoate cleavage protein n=1 Tax=Olivibacter sp. SDN3 TaxID=2764720 RepID=UPI0016516477|nr:3-keto-5-aminohexanoate cleavage protein [Olivibacter sp. SDN3]QNL50151.1 3-keto-5-aminohexanoate cleavage protein [Olivibacter sp. SDN3]
MEIAEILIAKGIGIEAGLSNSADAQKLAGTGLYKHCFRFLIEPQEKTTYEALTNVTSIEKILRKIHTNQSVLLHGTDTTVWDLVSVAFSKKIDTRIGFEDTVYLEPNSLAKSNYDLIGKAIRIRQKMYNY